MPRKLIAEAQEASKWRMPEESDRHLRTWMAFGARREVWGRRLLPRVREDLAKVASAIAEFEPVTLCVRPNERKLVEEYFEEGEDIEFFEVQLNDLWIRDYGAVFVVGSEGRQAAVDFNFNGWGEKQSFASDANVAKLIAEKTQIQYMRSILCLEGGGIEVDGQGTAIITESCVLNRNRNPNWSKGQCEEELQRVLGIEKVIWLPGVRGVDITDGHTDFYARFTGPGVVVAHLDLDRSSSDYRLTRQHLGILQSARDAKGTKLKVITLESPKVVRPEFDSQDFCAGYINFYVCNDAVIAPQFGDRRADGKAKETLQELFPKREIVMLDIDGIAAGGGGIHCATQQQPA
ncbi:MAG: agmatine deiminase family protein [Planctomycetota bacterium]